MRVKIILGCLKNSVVGTKVLIEFSIWRDKTSVPYMGLYPPHLISYDYNYKHWLNVIGSVTN